MGIVFFVLKLMFPGNHRANVKLKTNNKVMDILNLEGTEDTPKIILDKKNGIMEISGRSLPEDSTEFYKPVLDWIENYANDPNSSTVFVFKLEYFNTASSKLILDLLYAL